MDRLVLSLFPSGVQQYLHVRASGVLTPILLYMQAMQWTGGGYC